MIYSFDRTTLAESMTDASEQRECLNIEAKASIGAASFSAIGNAQYSKCQRGLSSSAQSSSFVGRNSNVKATIEGGLSSMIGMLQGGIVFSTVQSSQLKADYSNWVSTIDQNPIMLTYELRSIDTLFDARSLHNDTLLRLQPLSDLATRLTHLRTALKTYLEIETVLAWVDSNCPACAIGVPVFVVVPPATEKSCACRCPSGTDEYECVPMTTIEMTTARSTSMTLKGTMATAATSIAGTTLEGTTTEALPCNATCG